MGFYFPSKNISSKTYHREGNGTVCYILKREKDQIHTKTSMLWPSQNFLLHKSTILIKYFISKFFKFCSIEAEIRLSRVFQKKKKNNRASH